MSKQHTKMLFGKKGQFEEQEADKLIFLVVVYMILLLAGIFTINRFVEGVDVRLKCETQNIEYQILANRILNSATCLAWEQPVAGNPNVKLRYASGGEWWMDGSSTAAKRQVRAGIIDLSKVHRGATSIGDCLGTVINKPDPKDRPDIQDIRVEIFDSEGTLKESATFGGLFRNPITDTFIVKILDNDQFYDGRAKITISMPKGEQCV